MLGAEFLAQYLLSSVSRVFTFPGGTVAPIYDALAKLDVPIYVARHEQGAGYAALACARLSGKPEVVMVTSGPGVTNLLTVLADAFYDSTPLVAITGQVGTADLRAQRCVRQKGFQEVNTPALVSTIVKAAFSPMTPDELPGVVGKAFSAAAAGRPGPVVIDLPMDVQRSELSPSLPERTVESSPFHAPPDMAEVFQFLGGSRSPVVLAGHGVLLSAASGPLREFAAKQSVPIVSSLLGVGAMPGDSPLYLGFVGHTGSQVCGKALQQADCVLVLGSRLDVRQTGTLVDKFCPQARILRIDIDSAELECPRVRIDVNILADAGEVLAAMADMPPPLPETAAARRKWLETIARWRKKFSLDAPAFAHTALSGPQVVRALDASTAGKKVIVSTGVGAHQHWAARHFTFDWPDRILLTSGGHGAMGYDVPSVMGAALARSDATPICIVGDASFQMNMQEMQFAIDYSLPVRIIVLDNSRMAMVSQFQQLTWGKDPTTGSVSNPDFAAVARAYGYAAETVSEADSLDGAIRRCLAATGPALLHCKISAADDVIPMLLGGQALDGMYPYVR
jgi:acetolactate synthase-1/2/3 large subunit